MRPDDPAASDARPARRGLSRRAVLLGGGAAAGAAAVAGAGFAGGRATAPDRAAAVEARTYPFTGAHQAGVVTPAQAARAAAVLGDRLIHVPFPTAGHNIRRDAPEAYLAALDAAVTRA